MSDSGFPQFPSGPRPPEQSSRPSGRAETNARIVNSPRDLQDLQRSIRLSARVERVVREAEVRLQTPQGDLTVQLNKDVPLPKEGQIVEIQIPAGRPPQALRIEPAQTQLQTPQPLPQNASAQTTPSLPRITSTPLDVSIPQITDIPESFFTPKSLDQLLQPSRFQENIRLEPIAPQQLSAFIESTTPLEIFNTQTTRQPPSPLAQFLAPPETSQLTASLTFSAPELNAQGQERPPIFEAANRPDPLQTILDFKPQISTPTQQISIIEFFAPPEPQTTPKQNVPPSSLETLRAFATIQIEQPALPALTINAPNIIESTTPLERFNAAPPPTVPQADIGVQFIAIDPPEPRIVPPENDAPFKLETPQQNRITFNQGASENVAQIIAQTPERLPVLSVFTRPESLPLFFIAHVPGETLPLGANITLSPDIQNIGVQTAATSLAQNAAPAPIYFLTPEPWPLMDEIYQTLQQTAPQAAQAMSNLTPSPSSPAQMNSTLLFFVAALRAGEIPSWLGQRTLDALKNAGKSGSINRLGLESESLSRLAREPVSQDWRALSVPLMWENEVQKIALYYKHDQENGDEQQKRQKPTRFVFDLNLDRMGAVQIDGYFKGQRLDVILRTEQHFAKNVQQDMRRLYADALRNTQVTGELTFQTQNDQWVKITPNKKTLGMEA